MTQAIAVHRSQDEIFLDTLLLYFLLHKVRALQEVTNTRVLTPSIAFGSPNLSGDIAPGAIDEFLKLSPIFEIGINDGSFATSWAVDEGLERYTRAKNPDHFPSGTIDKVIYRIQADPFSFRRFNAESPGDTFNLRTFSKGHPPLPCIDILLQGTPSIGSIPPGLLEREIVRSFILHEILYERGVPFHSQPVALIEFMSTDAENFYQNQHKVGQVEVQPFTPLDLAISRKTRKNTMRLNSLTPERMEELAEKKGMHPRDYLIYVLNTIGIILRQLNYFEKDICFLSSVTVPRAVYQHFFGEEFGGNSSTGEFNVHNISIDLDTGDVALVDDLSYVFPVTTREGENFLNSKITPYKVKVTRVSEDELAKARNSPIAYFIDTTSFSRPFVRCMYKAGLLTETEYREHIELIEGIADLSVRDSSLKKRSDERLIDDKIRKLFHDVFPYYEVDGLQSGRFTLYVPKQVRTGTEVHLNQWLLLTQLTEEERDNFFARVKGVDLKSRYSEIFSDIEQYNKDLPSHGSNQAWQALGEAYQNQVRGKVARILFDNLMRGYTSQ